MVTQKLNEQIKQVEELKVDIGRLQNQNSELEQRLTKLTDLEKEVVELQKAKATLLAQTDTLTSQLKAAMAEKRQTQTTLEETLNEKKTLKKTLNNLELDHGKVTEKLKETIESVQLLSSEKASLKTTVDELNATVSMSSSAGSFSDPNLEKEMRIQEQRILELEQNVKEWTELAKVNSGTP